MKIFTDVSKLALLRPLARTRRRLLGSTAAALALAYGGALASAHYILEVSHSVGLNLALVTADMFGVLVASYLTAATIADLTFPGEWREAVFMGKQHDAPERAPVERRDGEFMVILLLTIVGNALGVNYAAGDFIDQYHTSGYFRVQFRTAEPDARLDALDEVGADMSFELWGDPAVRRLVRRALDAPSSEVRARAAWTLGKMGADEARGDLIALLRGDGSATVRASAATALGKLGFHEQTRRLLENLLEETSSEELAVGLLRGLGLMAAASSVPSVVDQFDADSDDVAVHAFWAIRKIGSAEARGEVRSTIESDPDSVVRECAAYDALKKVAVDRDVALARRAYQGSESGVTCEERTWVEPDGTKHRLVIGDSFRVKMMKIAANHAAFEHESWFRRIAADDSEPDRIRQVASSVLRQIRRADQP